VAARRAAQRDPVRRRPAGGIRVLRRGRSAERFAPIDAPAAQRAAAIVKVGSQMRLGNYLIAFPVPFFLFFLGGLFEPLRRLAAGRDTLPVTALVAGTATALVWALGAVVADIELDLAQAGGDVETVSALDAIAPYTLALSAFPRAVFVAAASLPLLDFSDTAGWTGRIGLVIAGLSLIGTTTLLSPIGFPVLAVSSLLFDVWLLALCVVLLRVAARR